MGSKLWTITSNTFGKLVLSVLDLILLLRLFLGSSPKIQDETLPCPHCHHHQHRQDRSRRLVKVLGQEASSVFNNDNFKNKNPDNPTAPLFSILDTVSKYRWNDGAFRLKLCYPRGCIAWTQTSNPVTTTAVSGFQLVYNNFPGTPLFEGLAYSDSGLCAFLQSPSQSKPCWWGVAQTTNKNGKLFGAGVLAPRNALFVQQEDCKKCPRCPGPEYYAALTYPYIQ